jgi:SAM-dependent methyltransferase
MPMKRADFDRFADEYHALHAQNIGVTGETPDYFAEYKIRDVFNQAHTMRGTNENLKILDFGCGVGSSIPFWRRYFPVSHLVCVDVSARSLDIANDRFRNSADYVLFEGAHLPLKSGVFDIAFSACVFHHIPAVEHVLLLREIHRVLSKNSGTLYLYEHNPFNRLTLRAVNSCPFDEDAVLITPWRMHRQFQNAGFSSIYLGYRVFFPHALKHLRFLEPSLGFLPLGAQYCITGRTSNLS